MKTISLSQVARGRTYRVVGLEQADPLYAEKLYKMGFVQGTPIQLAPVALRDPVIVELRGSRIALRKNEAQHIYVQEL